MLTAKGQRADRETAIGTGADLFMTKPFSNAEVIAAVRQLAGVPTGRPACRSATTGRPRPQHP